MFGSVNQSSDEDPKPKLIVRIGFCTAKLLTLCVLYHMHTFLIDETFYPEYPSGLIWIQTMFANGESERERERERDWCRHVKVNIASADRQVEREREMCVLFEFRQFVFLLWKLVYVFQSFVSIFAKKNLIIRDV